MTVEARDVRRRSPRSHRAWGPSVLIIVLVGCLLYAIAEIRDLNRTVRTVQSQRSSLLNEAAIREALVAQLNTEHGLLMKQRANLLAEIDRLNALPPKVVVGPCQERETPIFESSHTVGR